jgi:type I restriction enzyme R subunit
LSLAPGQRAREQIDAQLDQSGWVVQDADSINLAGGRGVAVRNLPLDKAYGTADYILYCDRRALGVIEAKKEGETLTGVEVQAEKYGAGLSSFASAWHRPLPCLYQSTGVETQFTNALDPDPRSRGVFTFRRPETPIAWVHGLSGVAVPDAAVRDLRASYDGASTLLRRLRQIPRLDEEGMWCELQNCSALILDRYLALPGKRHVAPMTWRSLGSAIQSRNSALDNSGSDKSRLAQRCRIIRETRHHWVPRSGDTPLCASVSPW